MPVTTKTQRTGRFVDPWSYIALGAAGLVLLALMGSQFFYKRVTSETVYVEPEESVELESIQLEPRLIGALRIDVEAWLSTNTWVIYEIQILDQNGEVIASAMNEAWSESGTWQEDGESGTWYESDLQGGLDVQAKKNEKITVAIAVLEYGNTSGQELEQSVGFKVTVENGVVDTRYLWSGLIGSTILGIIAIIATPFSGKVAIAKTIMDSDPSGRATVGGADQLVRVKIHLRSDETSPRYLNARLVINDAYGEQVYARALPMGLSFKEEDGKVESATGQVQCFFTLDPRSSYGFQVDVKPDAPVDQTTLTVRDRNHTLVPVEVVHIRPSPLSDHPQDKHP
jgi:hypothetical protein